MTQDEPQARAKCGPKTSLAERDLYDAEHYRVALVAHHTRICELQEQNKALRKRAQALKAKHTEDLELIVTLKQKISALKTEVDNNNEHIRIAAGEICVSVPAPGSEQAKILRAFRELRYENDALKTRLNKRK